MIDEAFRSIIDIKKGGAPTVDQQELCKNWKNFNRSKLEPEDMSHKLVYARISSFYKQYQEMPDYQLLVDHFTKIEPDETALVLLDKIKVHRPRIGNAYVDRLVEMTNDQSQDIFRQFLSQANEIVVNGISDGKGKQKRILKGVEDAMAWLQKNYREHSSKFEEAKTESQITDTNEVTEEMERYKKQKNVDSSTLGIYTGLSEIDKVCNGLKNTEFMIIAAHVGQLKTTLSLNMLYRALVSGWNSAIASLEMTHDEIRQMLYVLHTCHPKWMETKFAHMVGKIDLKNVVQGDLSEEEEEFYFSALNDLCTDETYGKLFVWQPDNSKCTITDIEVKFLEYNAELKRQGTQLDFAVADYLALLAAENQSKDPMADLNQVIKRAKRMCLTFNNGQGIRFVSPFQINRKGFLEACNNGGLYNTTHLSQANEAEKSADVIIYSFMDEDMRETGVTLIGCLKNRRNPFFKPFRASVRFGSRYISDLEKEDINLGAELDTSLL